jgi:hypothetical protein
LRTLRSDYWADQIAPAGFSDFASVCLTSIKPSNAPHFLAEAIFSAT